MATQTIQRTEQVTQADFDRPNITDRREVEEKKTQAVMAAVVQLPAPMSGQPLIERIGNRIMAFHDSLSVPARTQRGRTVSRRVRGNCDWPCYW